MKKIKLYFNTIRYLKLSQIYWRLKYKIFTPRKPEAQCVQRRKWLTSWCTPTWPTSAWVDNNEFFFLGERGTVDVENSWRVSNKSHLWLYNLHYLDVLTREHSFSVEKEKELIDNWIKVNTNYNDIGWDPYCLSLRIVNMIKWLSKNNIKDAMVESVSKQAESLLSKIEYHILGNHLFANGKALVFAGVYLEGKAAENYLAKGLKILDSEIQEQFLDDGGHFELSPMYHQILMWDMCDLVFLAEITEIPDLKQRVAYWKSVIVKAEQWRVAMLHPDEDVAFFNDSSIGIAPPTYVIDKFLALLSIKSLPKNKVNFFDLKCSGYFSIAQAEGHKLIIDCAAIGPDYQPGHAHADTLSFELSVFGKRLFVNSGTSMYGVSAKREFQRSTLAHNTLVVANVNSSQTWGGFRVAKRARILERRYESVNNSIVIEASHDGYIKQKQGGRHFRKWYSNSSSLIVKDQITTIHELVICYYLHPDVEVIVLDKQNLILVLDGHRISFTIYSGELLVAESEWYPQFGVCKSSHVIQIVSFNSSVTASINWSC